MKRGIPDRGDILHLDLDPVLGKEQQGQRYVLVLTLSAFNRFGLALAAPITQDGRSLCDDPRRCEVLLKDYCG